MPAHFPVHFHLNRIRQSLCPKSLAGGTGTGTDVSSQISLPMSIFRYYINPSIGESSGTTKSPNGRKEK